MELYQPARYQSITTTKSYISIRLLRPPTLSACTPFSTIKIILFLDHHIPIQTRWGTSLFMSSLGHSTGSGITKVPGGNLQKITAGKYTRTCRFLALKYLHGWRWPFEPQKTSKSAGTFEEITLFGNFHLYGCHKPIYRYLWVSPVTDGGDSFGEKNTHRYHPQGPHRSPVLYPSPHKLLLSNSTTSTHNISPLNASLTEHVR